MEISAMDLRVFDPLRVSSCPSRSWLNVQRKKANDPSKLSLLPAGKRSSKSFDRTNHRHKKLAAYNNTTLTTCKGMDNQDFEGGGSRMVDEDMIVLRLRMKELEFMEKGQDVYVPSNWFQWEKKNYLHFQKGFYGAIGYLQLLLMNTRPSVALGIIALAITSVLFSSGLFMLQSIQMIQNIIPSFSSL